MSLNIIIQDFFVMSQPLWQNFFLLFQFVSLESLIFFQKYFSECPKWC